MIVNREKLDTLLTRIIISHILAHISRNILYPQLLHNYSLALTSSKKQRIDPDLQLRTGSPGQLGKVKGTNAFSKGHNEGDIFNPQSQIIISSGDG